ncbi:hypothetical protein [Mycobacterium phage WXIN]|nr:hypothetical protein [Mycobacterium phage WXIN]
MRPEVGDVVAVGHLREPGKVEKVLNNSAMVRVASGRLLQVSLRELEEL